MCVRGIESTSIVQATEHALWIALARLFLVSEARVLCPEIIAHEIDRRIRTGFETKGASQRIEVPSVDVRSIIEIRRITVAVHIYARQPHADHIPDRDVDHATRSDAVEIAILEFRFSLEKGRFGFRGHNITYRSEKRRVGNAWVSTCRYGW